MRQARTLSRILFSFIGLLMICAFAPEYASASVLIPKNLTRSDREEALRIIGFGTSNKILSDPYPLGGYAGFEAGLAVEALPAEDLGRLGAGLDTPQQDVSFPKLTVGKGLYNNVDLFFHFIPYSQQSEISQWGAAARWGFYQAKFLPLSASVLLHFNNANISNLIVTRTYGLDFVGGIDVNDVALYMGIGTVQSQGSFIGGDSGVTNSAKVESEAVSGLHTLIGATVRVSNYFLALELDRYTQAVFSGKLGIRF